MSKAIFGIIVAAGSGSRFGSKLPKQYQPIAHKTILEHSIEALLALPLLEKIAIVLAKDDVLWPTLAIAQHPKILTTIGGATRAQSTLNGLTALTQLANAEDLVLVHDAARPYVPREDLEKLVTAANNNTAGAILAAPVADTIKMANNHQCIEFTVPREHLFRALTPQCFYFGLLQTALAAAEQQGITVTDDAMALELLGYHPTLVPANLANIKITYPQDIDFFEHLLTKN